jgi:branched-chain amino acid transport system substrate-binding protein
MNRRNLLKVAMGAGASFVAMPALLRAESAPIRIGSVLSTTGPAAYLGEPGIKTLQLYVPKINASGGLLGRMLELVAYDDAGDATKANSFAKRLLDVDNADILLAGSTTGTTMAMIPLVESRQVPLIALAGGVSIIEPVKKWVFKTPATDRMAAQKVFADMKKRGFTKLALLTETSGFGQSGLQQATLVAPDFGLTVVARESFGPRDTDMIAQLTKIRGSEAEAVFIIGTNPATAIVTKNFRQLSLKQAIYHANGITSQEFITLAGNAAEGVLAPSSPLTILDHIKAGDPQFSVLSEYAKSYREKYNEDAVVYGGGALDGLLLYIDAVKRAGTIDKAAVRDAIEKTANFPTSAGIVTMSPTDHMGLDARAFHLVRVEGGKWRPA